MLAEKWLQHACSYFSDGRDSYSIFPQISTILILRNPSKNSSFVCLWQHRSTLVLPSKIHVPEQTEAIFVPLCSERLNRLNEQAQNKPSHLNGFTCKAIFAAAQHCWPNWQLKSACCLLRLHFTSLYGLKNTQELSTPQFYLKFCVFSCTLTKIMIHNSK